MKNEIQEQEESSSRQRLRPNLLLVLLMAYGAIVGIFFGLVIYGVDAERAFNLINAPFVALIGGTLAVAKDLI